jgi:tetratricopeptide (TPR) repeat protein
MFCWRTVRCRRIVDRVLLQSTNRRLATIGAVTASPEPAAAGAPPAAGMLSMTISEATKHTLRFKVQGLTPLKKQIVARNEITQLLRAAQQNDVIECAEVVRALNDLAFAYFVSGETLIAGPMFEKALSLARDEYYATRNDPQPIADAARDMFLMCLRFVVVLRNAENAFELIAAALDESIQLLRPLPPKTPVYARGASEPPMLAGMLLLEQLERVSVVRQEMGFTKQAIEALDLDIELRMDANSPTNDVEALGHTYNLRGRIQCELRLYADAIESHTLALEAFPSPTENHAITRILLTDALYASGDYMAAKACMRVALKRLTTLYPANDNLLLASVCNTASKVHLATGGILIALKYKKLELTTVETVLRRKLGDVSQHPKLLALAAEVAAIEVRVRIRTSQQQRMYRERKLAAEAGEDVGAITEEIEDEEEEE